ncbi:MAG: SMI1/KNR4 family protein [Bacteroidota bacterium]
MDLISKFEKIVTWFYINGEWEDTFRKLNRVADIDRLDKIKKLTESELPDDFKSLYSKYNGEENEKGIGNWRGHTFMSLNEIIYELNLYIENSDTEEGISSYPEKAIKIKYYHVKWIPIFSDYCGNFIGIDLDPDEKGKYGQVIIFGRDEAPNIVIANSLNDFFDFNLDLMNKGGDVFKTEKHLHDIYRQLKVK